jgi:hypothetical protein
VVEYAKIICCYFKDISFVKRVHDCDELEIVRTLMVLNNFMDSEYLARDIKIFTKGACHGYITFVLITQIFHKVPSSSDISLNSKYIVVFKNPTQKAQIVYLSRQNYIKNIFSFHTTYLDSYREPRSFLSVTIN